MEGVAGAEEETVPQRSHKMGQGAIGLGMLGRRQVTPRWANDPVWKNSGSRQESGQGRLQEPPPQKEIRRRSEKGGAG